MLLHDVAEFVTDRGGQFGLVIHQREQPACDKNVARRHGVRVGHRLVEHIEAIGPGKPGAADQLLAHFVRQRLQPRRGIGGADLLLDLAGKGGHAGLGHRGGLRRIVLGRAGAGEREEREEQ